MTALKVSVIVICFATCFAQFPGSNKTDNIDLYVPNIVPYPSQPFLVHCQANRHIKHVRIVRPDNISVVTCVNDGTSRTCSSVWEGYEFEPWQWKPIRVNITKFTVSVDEGKWACQDADTGEQATLILKAFDVYKVIKNLLPDQKNYSKEYLMDVFADHTWPMPQCTWKIMNTKTRKEIKIHDDIKIEVFRIPCLYRKNLTCPKCSLEMKHTPQYLLNKHVLFSVEITHPSLRGQTLHPDPTPVLYFRRNDHQ